MPVALGLGGLLLLLLALAVPALRRGLGRLLALLGRSLVALGGLAALRAAGGAAIGLGLGVNLWNALVVGALGLPGVGLLLMLHWVTGL